MRAVLQRVQSASVSIDNAEVARVGKGYLILLGVEQGDTLAESQILSTKIAALRIFEDDNGKLNRSIREIDGEVLVVSNFTLCADCKKGNRPSFTRAASPKEAEGLYEKFCELLSQNGICRVETGRFGADMAVSLVNDGPVTIVLDAKEGAILS